MAGVDDVSRAAAGQLHTTPKVLAQRLNLAVLPNSIIDEISGFSTTGHTALDHRYRK